MPVVSSGKRVPPGSNPLFTVYRPCLIVLHLIPPIPSRNYESIGNTQATFGKARRSLVQQKARP